MMKRCFIALALLMFLTPCMAQEVVVFKNHRSIRIVSHSMKSGWTYLKLQNGEMAVLSDTILSISKETTKAPADLTSSPAGKTGGTPSAADKKTPAVRTPLSGRPAVQEPRPVSPAEGSSGGRLRRHFDPKRGPRPSNQGKSPRPVRRPRKKR